jgi:hypothetical protein
MARTKTSHRTGGRKASSPRTSAKPAKLAKSAKPRASRPPPRDPTEQMAEEMAEDMAAEMAEIISCPVLVADDQADRVFDLMLDSEQTRDLAVLCARLHPRSSVAPLLAEVAATLDRHARELGDLVDRLVEHTTHDVPHDHIEPTDGDLHELLAALFGEPVRRLPRP